MIRRPLFQIGVLFSHVAVLFVCLTTQPGFAQRNIVNFDRDWLFYQGEQPAAADLSQWTKINVPHDWSIAGSFAEDNPTGGAGGFLPAGIGWYRKTFPTPDNFSGRILSIEFDGVMANCAVTCNGQSVGGRPNGYVSFALDLTPYVKPESGAENVLSVRVDNAPQPASRWYTGAGIYRHVRLVETHGTRIARDGVFVTTPAIEGNNATVHVAVEIAPGGKRPLPADAKLRSRIVSPEGKTLSETESAVESGTTTGALQHELDGITRWTLETPALYSAETELILGEETVDQTATAFGIRTSEFRADTGYWLNDRNIKLKGVCLHHAAGGVGAAVPMRVWERRLQRLRALGVNAIRTAHNPVAPEFLDLCDRMGFLVMDEFFDCWTSGKNRHDYHKYFQQWWQRDLQDTVRRDRNHPSVIMYSVGNEIRDTHRAEQAKQILGALVDACHAVDPTRPVTQGLFRPNTTDDYNNGLADLLDVIGTNYRDKELLAAWRDDPTRKIVCTEQGHDRGRWLDCRDAPQHAGQFLWVGIDYLGESRRWPATTFDAGLLDRTGVLYPRGMQRASWWSDEPVVFAVRRIGRDTPTPEDPGYEAVEWIRPRVQLADWTPGSLQPHEETVEVYSNCEQVELLLNGNSLGLKPLADDGRPRVWKVPFAPGELVAVGQDQGSKVAEHRLRTAGEPAGLRIQSDRPELRADFDDVAHVEVEVVDKSGERVPNADHLVTFSVEGPAKILAVDNGSIVSMEPFQADSRKAFRGRCLMILHATDDNGRIVVRASAGGFAPAEVVVRQ